MIFSSLKSIVKIVSLASLIYLSSSPHLVAEPIQLNDFRRISREGFGDRNNTQAWSMAYWKKKLLVGTGRSLLCQQAASVVLFRPDLGEYPPPQEPKLCTPKPEDLPLRAEIWQWQPGFSGWKLIFQSPEDVPVPGSPGKFVARDVGYRSMLVFNEPNGQEALYTATVSARAILEESESKYLNNPDIPPPRLLRSTDGNTFTPVPQDPGTLLADLLPLNGFRTLTAYKGRLYLVASIGLLGHGDILESSDPAQGNDSFRKVQVTSKDLKVFEMAVYNGALYVGTGDSFVEGERKFSVLKTETDGSMPYTFKEIIPPGAFSPIIEDIAVISMHVYNDRLIVGTERTLFAINPDDTWDVLAGSPRNTPQGMKAPYSGMDMGFDYLFNIHMWRLGTDQGLLHVGTQDQSAAWRNVFPINLLVQGRLGFDLYVTPDRYHYWLSTQTGFNDRLSNGVRNFANTPYGFFLGSSNLIRGTRILRGSPRKRPIDMPEALEIDFDNDHVILSWEGPQDAQAYHIYRDELVGRFKKIAEVDGQTPFYVDVNPESNTPEANINSLSQAELRQLQLILGLRPTEQVNANQVQSRLSLLLAYLTRNHYYVVADNGQGKLSHPSNVVRSPQIGIEVTFDSLKQDLSQWQAPSGWRKHLQDAQSSLDGPLPRYSEALDELAHLRQLVVRESFRLPASWRSDDLVVRVDKLVRRVELAELGLLPLKAFL